MKVIIYGGGGHGKVVLEAAELAGFKVVGYSDQKCSDEKTNYMGVPAIDKSEIKWFFESGAIEGVVVAIGHNFYRMEEAISLSATIPGLVFPKVIHPKAVLSKSATVEDGSVILAGAHIGTNVKVGRFAIVNTMASLDHDSTLFDFASMAPGAITGGNCSIREFAYICLGASLIHNLEIGQDSVVGAHSVVTRSVGGKEVVYGVPAKTVRFRTVEDKVY